MEVCVFFFYFRFVFKLANVFHSISIMFLHLHQLKKNPKTKRIKKIEMVFKSISGRGDTIETVTEI